MNIPSPPSTCSVAEVRDASRTLVRELGFMNVSVAGTDLPPSSVHALIEIEKGVVASSDLCSRLKLDKSSVSRMVRKLINAGFVDEQVNRDDGRVKILALTREGQRLVAQIHAFAQAQVGEAMSGLATDERLIVQKGLSLYAHALAGRNTSASCPIVPELKEGYRPGLIARITGLHADYYAREHGLGQVFEARVAAGLAEFCDRLDNPKNKIWTVAVDGVICGSVAIDGEDLGENKAHLRWFIVGDRLRGAGAGRALLSAALEFADRHNFAEIHLDTFAGLNAARHLYEAAGFRLVQETPGAQWGKDVLEQKFVRLHP